MSFNVRKAFRVFEKHGFACAYCNEKPGRSKLQIDHLIPRSKGGSDDEQNLVPACVPCNQGKSSGFYVPHSVRIATDEEGFHVICQTGVWGIKVGACGAFVSGAVYGKHRIEVSSECYELEILRVWDRFLSQHIADKEWAPPHSWRDFESVVSLAKRITRNPHEVVT